MYTQSIYGTSGVTYNLNRETTQSEDKESVNKNRTATERRKAPSPTMYVGGNSMGDVARNVRAALEDVPKDSNGKVTFTAVKEYKENLEKEFSEKVKEDLTALGVDKDIEFRLVSQQGGGIAVVSDHKDKALVEKYFKSNPEMVKKFNTIEMLGNLDRAKSYQGQSGVQMKSALQMEAVDAFFATAAGNGMGMASLMMDMGPSGYFSGMAGLNVRV